GRANSYAAGMNYWLAQDLLRSLIGVKRDETPARIGKALQESVASATRGNGANVYPYLARLLEVPMHQAAEERVRHLTGEALQKSILKAFGDYVRMRAQQQALILVWEDLHWCDPSSLHVLETLFPLSREFPILLLLAYRPDESLTQQVEQKAAEACYERFLLLKPAPLTRTQGSLLIQNLLKIEALPEKLQEL